MIKLRTALLASVPLVAAGWMWLGHGTSRATAAGDAAAAPAPTLIAPGRVEPERDPVALSFETTGRIAEIDVDEGVAVKAGQVIARLDDRMAKARLAAADAAVSEAQARYQLAARGPRGEDIAAAKAEMDAALAESDHRTLEESRSHQLGQAGAIASASVDADESASRVARSTAAAATARYQALARGTRGEQIAEANAALEVARADREAAVVAVDQTVLRAPTDGMVLRRLAEVGALVTTMTPAPVVSMANVTKLEVRAEIDEADVAAIAVGKQAYATADAFGDQKFPVHVSRITHELGRKTVRDDDPRARVDTRVLEVITQFDTKPAVDLPLGIRMYVHFDR